MPKSSKVGVFKVHKTALTKAINNQKLQRYSLQNQFKVIKNAVK